MEETTMADLTRNQKGSMGLAGLSILGCFLPFVSISAIIVGTLSVSASQGDGIFVIISAAILLFLQFTGTSPRNKRGATLVIGLICLLLTVLMFISVQDIIYEANYECEGYCYASYGIGAYIMLLSSAGLVLLGIMKDPEVLPEVELPKDAFTANITYCPNPNCGKQNKRTDKFCGSCGTELKPS